MVSQVNHELKTRRSASNLYEPVSSAADSSGGRGYVAPTALTYAVETGKHEPYEEVEESRGGSLSKHTDL